MKNFVVILFFILTSLPIITKAETNNSKKYKKLDSPPLEGTREYVEMFCPNFNYGKNIRDIIFDRLNDDPFQNYIFSKIDLHGNLSNDFELISENISHAANKFFDKSDYSYNEITAFKTPIL